MCLCVRDQRNRGSLCLFVLQWFQRSRDDQESHSWQRWFYLTTCCVESKIAPLIYFEFHHHHRTVLALKSSTKWDRPTQFKRCPLLQTQLRSCCFVWQRIDLDGTLWFHLRSPSEFQVICGRVCVRLRACFCRHLCTLLSATTNTVKSHPVFFLSISQLSSFCRIENHLRLGLYCVVIWKCEWWT